MQGSSRWGHSRFHRCSLRHHQRPDGSERFIMISFSSWILLPLASVCVLYSYDYHKEIVGKFISVYGDFLNTVTVVTEGVAGSLPGGSDKLFTKEELGRYSNSENGLYLAVLGQVYDVSRGERHYGPGATYHGFTGRDASLAFVTGEFTDEGLTDDVSSLTPRQIKMLNGWAQFYAKDYMYKGKLIGRYYDKDGSPTGEYYKLQQILALAEREKSNDEQNKIMFPPCNIEWKPDVGTRVWCTKKSGGIERDWVGVPRMLYETGSEQYRCVCINSGSREYKTIKGTLREYEGCAEGSTNCIVKNS